MKRRFALVTAAIGLVALLAGVAYLAGRFVTQRAEGDDAGGVLLSGGPGGAMAGRTMKVDVAPAKQLPPTPPEAAGVFVRREDHSIYIGTGNHGFAGGGDAPAKPVFDGPVLEVVCTPYTEIYRDVTKFPESISTDTRVYQAVEAGSLSEIDEQSSLRVWGERKGDRIIARVLLYTQPKVLRRPGSDPRRTPSDRT